MSIIKKSNQHTINIILLITLFLIAMLFFSCYTSPLYPNYFGYDSAIFLLLGKGLCEGKDLYIDLFDHKGPFIFFFNALGNAIGGRTGIFILQCIFGAISIIILYNIRRLLKTDEEKSPHWKTILCLFCGYAVFFYTFQRGNLTEEYSVPFIACSLYLFMKYVLSSKDNTEHSVKYGFVHGINFAVLVFLRLNNAATIGMGVLVIGIYLLIKRNYKNLIYNMISSLMGVLIVSIPIMIYFNMKSSLYEMIYSTFLHNFTIAQNTGHLSISEKPVIFFVLYLPIILCCLLVIRKAISTKSIEFIDVFLICILGINILSLWIANRFPHYFATFFPVYFVFLCKYVDLNNEKKSIKWIGILLVVCTLLNGGLAAAYSLSSVNDVYIEKSSTIRYNTIKNDTERIPEEERDSIIGYKISSADYLSANIIPCYKYYTLQDTWAISNPQILTDFTEWLKLSKPLWVLVKADESDNEIMNILDENYKLEFYNEYVKYYRANE